MSSGLSVDEIMALFSYDALNFRRWIAYGSARVERGEMSEAELKRILLHYAARILWSKDILVREKKRAWLERWIVRKTIVKIEDKLRAYSIWDDAQALAQELSITLGDRNSEALSDVRHFSRLILTVSPRLKPAEITLINEEGALGRGPDRNPGYVRSV